MKTETYQRVTDRIAALLEAGARPWARPWNAAGGSAPVFARPLRSNGQPYTGVNVLNLWAAAEVRGFSSRYWMTFNTAKELGAQVRKGAKAEQAFFASAFTKEDEKTGEDRTIAFLKCYNVFNADEIDGLPARFHPSAPPAPVEAPATAERDPACEAFIAGTGAKVEHGGGRAFYQPSADRVRLPHFEAFTSAAGYYGTAFHELAHWSGHETRLARKLTGTFGDADYAGEELVAELAAAYLCADLGIAAEPREDHAAYIESWLRALKSDNRAVFRAAAAAEAAAKFLHGLQPQELAIAA